MENFLLQVVLLGCVVFSAANMFDDLSKDHPFAAGINFMITLVISAGWYHWAYRA